MSKNKNGGKQSPAQRHAEGQHGTKTTDFLREQHAAQAATPRAKAERQAAARRKG